MSGALAGVEQGDPAKEDAQILLELMVCPVSCVLPGSGPQGSAAPWNLSSLWWFPLSWTGFLLFFPFFQGGNVPMGSPRGLCCVQGSVPSPTSLMNIRTSLAPPCQGGFYFFPPAENCLSVCCLSQNSASFSTGEPFRIFKSDQTLGNRQ